MRTTLRNRNSIQENRSKSFGAESFVVQFVPNNIKIKKYKTTILCVAWHECQSWTLTLREKRNLWVFEKSVFRSIQGPQKDEVTRVWRTPHNEELNDLYNSPNIIRVVKLRIMRR